MNLGAGGKKSREREAAFVRIRPCRLPLRGESSSSSSSSSGGLIDPSSKLGKGGGMKKERIIRELESKRWRRRSVRGDNELCSFDELCYFDLASSLDLYSGEEGREGGEDDLLWRLED